MVLKILAFPSLENESKQMVPTYLILHVFGIYQYFIQFKRETTKK